MKGLKEEYESYTYGNLIFIIFDQRSSLETIYWKWSQLLMPKMLLFVETWQRMSRPCPTTQITCTLKTYFYLYTRTILWLKLSQSNQLNSTHSRILVKYPGSLSFRKINHLIQNKNKSKESYKPQITLQQQRLLGIRGWGLVEGIEVKWGWPVCRTANSSAVNEDVTLIRNEI